MQRDDQALTVVGSGAAWASATPPASLSWSLVGCASAPASPGRHLGGFSLSRDCGRKSGVGEGEIARWVARVDVVMFESDSGTFRRRFYLQCSRLQREHLHSCPQTPGSHPLKIIPRSMFGGGPKSKFYTAMTSPSILLLSAMGPFCANLSLFQPIPVLTDSDTAY
jgi:hypothetical protein